MSTAPARVRTARRRRPASGLTAGGGTAPHGARGGGLDLCRPARRRRRAAVGGERGRLLHEIDGAGVERRQHLLAGLVATLMMTIGTGRRAICCAHERHAVHLRHVQVAGDDVGLQLLRQLERLLRRRARCPRPRRTGCAPASASHLADVGRVVDHEHADDRWSTRPAPASGRSWLHVHVRSSDVLAARSPRRVRAATPPRRRRGSRATASHRARRAVPRGRSPA